MVRGLQCDGASVHYKNCLMLKIKLNFMLLCALFILSFFFIAYLSGNVDSTLKNSIKFIVVIAVFILLKGKFVHNTHYHSCTPCSYRAFLPL